MTDVVKVVRERYVADVLCGMLLEDACDEIEELRNLLARGGWEQVALEAEAEIERLREALRRISENTVPKNDRNVVWVVARAALGEKP